MDLNEAIRARHSVRSYLDQQPGEEVLSLIRSFLEECNRESGLHMQLITGEEKAFSGFLAHYGLFSGVKNYIALVGPKTDGLEEKCGWQGEKAVLFLQQLGLNTCWVAGTYRKVPQALDIRPGEKLVCVIALGYGKTQGHTRRSKTIRDVAGPGEHPEWFLRGVEAALLAPTAINQQRFRILREGTKVEIRAGFGPCARIDLGIVKCHFEIGAGRENFEWSGENSL